MISTNVLCCFTQEFPPSDMLGRDEEVQKRYDAFCRDKTNGKKFIEKVKKDLEEV